MACVPWLATAAAAIQLGGLLPDLMEYGPFVIANAACLVCGFTGGYITGVLGSSRAGRAALALVVTYAALVVALPFFVARL